MKKIKKMLIIFIQNIFFANVAQWELGALYTTPLSEPERQLLVPYSTKANAFCELGRKKIGKNEPCSPQKAFAFVEYGTRSCFWF